jgi:hypothetical protein
MEPPSSTKRHPVTVLAVDFAVDRVVETGAVLVTPGVELEVEQFNGARFPDGNGAVVPGPGIVGCDGKPSHVAQVGTAAGQLTLDSLTVQAGVCGNYHLLLVAEGIHQFVVKRFDVRQQSDPVGTRMGPGQLDGVLRVPLCQ